MPVVAFPDAADVVEVDLVDESPVFALLVVSVDSPYALFPGGEPEPDLLVLPPVSDESEVGSVSMGSEEESPLDAAGSGGDVLLSLSSELSDMEFSSHSFNNFCKLETC